MTPTRRDDTFTSFLAVVCATLPTKVVTARYLDLVAPVKNWRKSSLEDDGQRHRQPGQSQRQHRHHHQKPEVRRVPLEHVGVRVARLATADGRGVRVRGTGCRTRMLTVRGCGGAGCRDVRSGYGSRLLGHRLTIPGASRTGEPTSRRTLAGRRTPRWPGRGARSVLCCMIRAVIVARAGMLDHGAPRRRGICADDESATLCEPLSRTAQARAAPA